MTAAPPAGPGPIVAVGDVFVAFRGAAGAVMALRGAELAVAAGERLLVQGPNGSGKSTLLRVVTGEQSVIAGSVRVGGTPLHDLGSAERRQWRARTVGFIDQHARRSLLPERSVLDNVALQLRLSGTAPRTARAMAAETLRRLDLAHLTDRPVPELSGGEAQLVAICAAVAHDPHLLLADEPTGELDDDAAQQIYGMLTLIARTGTSLVTVSHDPRAEAFADRIVWVRDGRIAEQWFPGMEGVQQVPDSRGWVRPQTGQDAGQPADRPLVDRESGEPVAVLPTDRGTAPVAELLGVSAGFAGNSLFEHLDLQLRPGSWTAVCGPSGSGKSTLLALVAGLADPVSGVVAVGGAELGGCSRAERAEVRRAWVALAPQRFTLVEALTVRENLDLTARVRGVEPDADEIADQLGLTPLLDQPVHRLSGGERQRVSLGRCLASAAPVLVLDEPTSQQDGASVDRVVHALLAAVAHGRAVLVASHDPLVISRAHRTVRLGGRPYAGSRRERPVQPPK